MVRHDLATKKLKFTGNWIDPVFDVKECSRQSLSMSCLSPVQLRFNVAAVRCGEDAAQLDWNLSTSIEEKSTRFLPAQPTFSTDSWLFLSSLLFSLSFLFLSSSSSLLLLPSSTTSITSTSLSPSWGSLAGWMSSNFTFLSLELLLELELAVDPRPSSSFRSSSQRPTPESEQMKTSHIFTEPSYVHASLASQCSKTHLSKDSFSGSNYPKFGSNWVHPCNRVGQSALKHERLQETQLGNFWFTQILV